MPLPPSLSHVTEGCGKQNPQQRKLHRQIKYFTWALMTNNCLPPPQRKSHLAFFFFFFFRWPPCCSAVLAPRAALTGTQLQSRCVAVPNHPRTRKKTKLQGVLGEYSWSGHTLPVADMVGCLPARKRNMFSRRHRLFVCHSIRQSSDSIFSLSLSLSAVAYHIYHCTKINGRKSRLWSPWHHIKKAELVVKFLCVRHRNQPVYREADVESDMQATWD